MNKKGLNLLLFVRTQAMGLLGLPSLQGYAKALTPVSNGFHALKTFVLQLGLRESEV